MKIYKDGILEAQPISITSLVPVRTSVASSITTVTLINDNVARKGAMVYNDSTSILYLALGSGASVTSFTYQISASSLYTIPFGYTGIVTGVWASVNGNARITEVQ